MLNRSVRLRAAAIVLSLLVAGCGRSEEAAEEDKPADITIQKRLEILLEAAQKGDVKRYAECFTDPAASQLQARMKPFSESEIAANLRSSEAELRGFSTIEQTVNEHGGEAKLLIEKVYPEHNERYRVRMKRLGREWKIAEMQPVEKTVPKIKFGTPVVPLPPRKK